jgi:hypothetical protein
MKTQDPTYAAVTLTIWVFAELNAGLMAASIPALKSTFEAVLRRFGATSGLVTSRQTYDRNAYGGRDAYAPGTYGKGTNRHTYSHCDDVLTMDEERHHGSTYEMHTPHMKSKSRVEVEARSLEEDQKHILGNSAGVPQTDQGPWGITKTVVSLPSKHVSTDRLCPKCFGIKWHTSVTLSNTSASRVLSSLSPFWIQY